MVTITVTKTSKEAQRDREEFKKDEEKKRKSRYCPECGKFQLFRSKLTVGVLGTMSPIHIGYSYKCKCGCEWQCCKDRGNGRY